MRRSNLYIDFSKPIASEKLQIMEDVIDEFNLIDRDLICMHYGFGEYAEPYSLREIGDILNISKQAVSKKIKSIQKIMKQKVRIIILNNMQ